MNNEDLMDLFAALAMQGYLTQSYVQNQECIAKDSYAMAEAMIKEKERRLVRERTFTASSN
jgi:hypothetical protein